MKIVFICYNYLTLYKAVYNAHHFFRDHESMIIYRTAVTNLNVRSISEIPVTVIPVEGMPSNGIISRCMLEIKWGIMIRRTIRVLKKEIDENPSLKLVVFKDNEPAESSFIEYFKKHTSQKGEVYLIEEGNSIYWTMDKNTSKPRKFIWRIYQKYFGLSKFFLDDYPQGYNPLVDKIICSDCIKIVQLKGLNQTRVIEQKGIYNVLDSQKFMHDVLGKDMSGLIHYQTFKAVHLTLPTTDMEGLNDLEWQILEIIDSNLDGSLLIKKHPRDTRDQFFRESNKMTIAKDEICEIPAECLYGLMNNPIIFTYYSSAYSNILVDNPEARIVLLYKLMNDDLINNYMDSIIDYEMDRYPNIYRPNNLDELNKVILRLMEEEKNEKGADNWC
ncbi:MAG: hypothetical protein SCL54_14580 [Bacillota bacterium]|nr:hypothetical protein [Bacillota bacterium]